MKDILIANIAAAKAALIAAERALHDFNVSPENNVFDTLDQAEGVIEDRLRDQAREDCEGSYNCGSDEYTQEFIVAGERYIGTLECEYNRHDKTYYYLEHAAFSVAKAGP